MQNANTASLSPETALGEIEVDAAQCNRCACEPHEWSLEKPFNTHPEANPGNVQ